MRRASRKSAPGAAITPRPIPSIRLCRRAPIRSSKNNAAHSVETHPGLSPAAVEESLSALAHRDVLGVARRRDHIRPVLALRMEAEKGIVALLEVGELHGWK